ncbi:MAG: bacterial transcriptional activator domain-containing protein [Desulfobacteraceae bacterium]|nr:bacterial transcriptional activator domain-containing protein [Desulfobacteraceae bacterium]
MKYLKTWGNSPYSPFLFYSILFIFPIVFFMFLEVGLRVADYGENLELFVPAGKAYPNHFKANKSVRLRYFSKEDKEVFPRSDYFLKQKPKNGYRIFMLGGSTAVGWPFGENMMPSRPLSRRLSETFADKQIEVINLAFTAINTYSQLDFVDEILEQEPDAILIYSGHNEFYGALGIGSAKSVGKHRWLVNAYLRLQHLKSFMLLKEMITSVQSLTAKGGGDKPKVSLMRTMVQDTNIPYNSPVYKQGVNQFEGNLRDIIGKFRAAGVDVIVSELVSNLKDQAPFVSISSDEQESADKAFHTAEQLEQEGRFDEARKAYIRAKDLDALRFRAPEEFNEIINRLGTEFDVPVVPMKSYFESASLNSIIGSNLMMEHLHPNVNGFFLMSEAFFDVMRKEGMIARQWPQFPEAGEFRKRWGVSEFDNVLARLRIMELKDKWPFKPVELSGHNFRNFKPDSKMEALALQVFIGMMNLIEAHHQLARKYEADGDSDAALREYRAMIEIYPYSVELYLEVARAVYRLGKVDEILPILLRAAKIKPLPEVMIWIGQIYLHYNDLKQAISYLEKAYLFDTKNDPGLISLLIQAYEKDGQNEKARKMKALLPLELNF